MILSRRLRRLTGAVVVSGGALALPVFAYAADLAVVPPGSLGGHHISGPSPAFPGDGANAELVDELGLLALGVVLALLVLPTGVRAARQARSTTLRATTTRGRSPPG